MQLPHSIVLVHGGYCLDGGSIYLTCRDSQGCNITMELDWSIEAQQNETVQLKVNEQDVPKGSAIEDKLIVLLRSAPIEYSEPNAEADRTAATRVVIGDDIEEVMGAIDRGPTDALDAMRNQLLKNVQSPLYRGSETA